MKNYIAALPKKTRDLIYLARDIAEDKKISVYLVGGIVRDLLLGVSNLDLDFVVEGEGIAFAEAIASSAKAKIIRHERFATATLFLPDGRKLDVATARKETYPHPAALPVVAPGKIADDLSRRDFTINAMAVDITNRNFGELLDFFGGVADLRDKHIVILHEGSFIDDPTRILRAIRFEQRYRFSLGAKTLRCLKDASRKKMLEKVHAHRIRDELILLFKEKDPYKNIMRLKKLYGVDFISPYIKVNTKDAYLYARVKKEIDWYLKNNPRQGPEPWFVFFLLFTDSLKQGAAKALSRRLAFSKKEENKICAYKSFSVRQMRALCLARLRPSQVFAQLKCLSIEALLVLRAKSKKSNFRARIKNFITCLLKVTVALSGDDLRSLGLSAGPYYHTLLTQLHDAKLDGLVATKKDEMALAKALINKRRLYDVKTREGR